MSKLFIAFRDGSRKSTTEIRAGGGQVYTNAAVTPLTAVSHADTVSTGWNDWPVRI